MVLTNKRRSIADEIPTHLPRAYLFLLCSISESSATVLIEVRSFRRRILLENGLISSFGRLLRRPGRARSGFLLGMVWRFLTQKHPLTMIEACYNWPQRIVRVICSNFCVTPGLNFWGKHAWSLPVFLYFKKRLYYSQNSASKCGWFHSELWRFSYHITLTRSNKSRA